LGADPQPAFHIFISYRREGNAIYAYRLHDFLLRGVADDSGFAEDQIFMDIDTIAPGDDFGEVIAEAVAKCDVLLAVIGKEWTTVKDERGRRKLSNAADWVRLEIEAALNRKIPVVPVLVDRAAMPKKAELPKSMEKLAHRNAIALSDSRWRDDVGRLLTSLKKREGAKIKADLPDTRRTPREQGGTTKRETKTSSTAAPSKRKTAGTAKPKGSKSSTAKPTRKTATKTKSTPTQKPQQRGTAKPATSSKAKPTKPKIARKTDSTPKRKPRRPTTTSKSMAEEYLPLATNLAFGLRRMRVFLEQLKVGDVLDCKVTSLQADHAVVTLIPDVTAKLPGRRNPQNALQFLPTGWHLQSVSVNQQVRVKIEEIGATKLISKTPFVRVSLVNVWPHSDWVIGPPDG
jgi:hypothetical protein